MFWDYKNRSCPRNYFLSSGSGKHNINILCVCTVVFDTLWPEVLQSARLLCPWDFPTGVGPHFLLQGIFPTQGLNPHLLHWQADSLPLSPWKAGPSQGKPVEMQLGSVAVTVAYESRNPHLQRLAPSKAHSPWSHQKQRRVHLSQAPDQADSLACSSQLACLQQWPPRTQNTTFRPSQRTSSQRGRSGTSLPCRCTLLLWQLWM